MYSKAHLRLHLFDNKDHVEERRHNVIELNNRNIIFEKTIKVGKDV